MMTEKISMANFIALNGICASYLFDKNCCLLNDLKEASKKIWWFKLSPSNNIACACQT